MMKKIAFCLAALLIFMGSTGFLYHKLNRTEFKVLSSEEDTDTLQYVNERLQSQNRKLKRQNRLLIAKLKRQKELIAAYRDTFRRERLEWIRRRLARVTPESVPFTGMVVVAASALEDARHYCSDMKRVTTLENDLFGFSSEEGYDNAICADDLNETAVKIRKDARKGIARFLSVDGNETEAVVSFWKEQINDGMASVSEDDRRLKAYVLQMYDELLEDLNVSSDIRKSLDETFGYWRYVFGL
jgi:hypothetical protein